MSNRSKKNVFDKEANDTLKRVLVSKEFRNSMMERVTGNKPKNGNSSLEWSLSNNAYLDIENKYNEKLAVYITDLRHKMADELEHGIKSQPITRTMERQRIIIPHDKFDEYWNQRKKLFVQLRKYDSMSSLYIDDSRRVIIDYIHVAESVLQHMFGSPLHPAKLSLRDYGILLQLYKKHEKEYGLKYPEVPDEFIS